MNIISVDGLSKTHGEKVLFDSLSFGIEDSDRIGLIGVNGTGKSTFLKVLAGIEPMDAGTVVKGNRVTIHYLPQEPAFAPGVTVLEQVFRGDHPQMTLLRDYETALKALDAHPMDESFQRAVLRLQTRMDAEQAWQLEHEAKTILTKLGITNFSTNVDELSGGLRKRIALANALIQPSDLLILDEPTNHLDNDSISWLESYLQKRKGALLMVTHDRYFLDRVVTRIFEIDKSHLYQYTGNYQEFLQGKLQREADARASEDKRQNFLRSELEWVRKGPRARGTKQKARTDRYYEILESTADISTQSVEISAASTRLGKTVIELSVVSKAYGSRVLIHNFSYIVVPGDRIGIVGPNGWGKSTLLKMMAGVVSPDSGQITVGQTVKIGYFTQEHQEMDPSVRVIEFIRDVAEYVETSEGESISASQMLERFLFPSSLQWTPIAKLSGGEKRRLALLRTLMSAPNVLLLDEVTNDLDTQTLAILEAYLDDFSGVVIAISHDRYFLDRVAEKIFAFEDMGNIFISHGNFSDYQNSRGSRSAAWESEAELATGAKTKSSPEPVGMGAKRTRNRQPTLKLTFSEQKEYETIEDKIAEVEQKLTEVTRKLDHAGSDYGKVRDLFEEQQALASVLEQHMERWTYLSERVEEIARSQSE